MANLGLSSRVAGDLLGDEPNDVVATKDERLRLWREQKARDSSCILVDYDELLVNGYWVVSSREGEFHFVKTKYAPRDLERYNFRLGVVTIVGSIVTSCNDAY